MFSDQEVFDRASTHLLQQMQISQDEQGNCLYRGPNGLKCALGCLIDDSWYKESYEGCVPRQVLTPSRRITKEQNETFRADIKAHVSENEALLSDLQAVHDGYHQDQWKTLLDRVAKKHGLVFEPR